MSRPRDDDPSRFRWEDPDETEGRRLYRMHAEAEARRSLNMARAVKLRTDESC